MKTSRDDIATGILPVLTASTSGFLEMVTPLTSVLLGIAFLHESFTLTQIAAMPLLIYSIYKISTARS